MKRKSKKLVDDDGNSLAYYRFSFRIIVSSNFSTQNRTPPLCSKYEELHLQQLLHPRFDSLTSVMMVLLLKELLLHQELF